MQALPAVSYSSDMHAWNLRQMLPDLVLVALVAAYVGFTIMDIWQAVHEQKKAAQAVAPER
jgi:hypothetical protein